MSRIAVRAIPVALIATSIAVIVSSAASDVREEWRAFGGTNASARYSALDQINRTTVSNLRIAWRQSATPGELRKGRPDPPSLPNYQNTPIMVDGEAERIRSCGVHTSTSAARLVSRPAQLRCGECDVVCCLDCA